MSLQVGMTKTLEETVTKDKLAVTLGSGSLNVYGTPAMLRLVEAAAVALLEGNLEEGTTTVGTNLNVDHVSASPLGAQITCTVTLEKIDRRALTFAVEVKDDAGLIGKGSHQRFIVESDKFQKKADAKLQQAEENKGTYYEREDG